MDNSSSKQCLVRWRNYSNSVAFAVQSLRFDEELLDVTIACEGNTIRAHKLVLAASSHYFRKILRDHPCEHPTIVIDGILWRDLLSILHFMYNGQVLIEEDAVCSLLTAATSLAIIGLSYVSTALVNTKVKGNSSDGLLFHEDNTTTNSHKYEANSATSHSLNTEEPELISNHSEDNSLISFCSYKKDREKNNLGLISGKVKSEQKDKLQPGAEPPDKRQKICDKNNLSNCIKVRRQDTGEEIMNFNLGINNDPKINNKLNCKEVNGRVMDSSKLKTEDSRQEEDVTEKLVTAEPSTSRVSSPYPVQPGTNHVVNGDEESKCSDESDFYGMDESQGATSFENEDMDLGPAPLPLNHPAVLAAAAATSSAAAAAAAMAAAVSGTLTASAGSASHVTAMNYAALLAASAKGLLQCSNNGNASSNGSFTSSSSLPWCPSVAEGSLSLSPVPGVNPCGLFNLPGMSQQELHATLEQYQRKLAFHEPRPCPTCKRMYRDAATLRTHIAIMHSEGKEPFTCTCGSLFRTKYDMYQHRKNGHR